MKNCKICKKNIRYDDPFSSPIEENYAKCHLSCSLSTKQIKKYEAFRKAEGDNDE